LKAVRDYGVQNVTPLRIKAYLNDDTISRKQIKSHLQKFRRKVKQGASLGTIDNKYACLSPESHVAQQSGDIGKACPASLTRDGKKRRQSLSARAPHPLSSKPFKSEAKKRPTKQAEVAREPSFAVGQQQAMKKEDPSGPEYTSSTITELPPHPSFRAKKKAGLSVTVTPYKVELAQRLRARTVNSGTSNSHDGNPIIGAEAPSKTRPYGVGMSMPENSDAVPPVGNEGSERSTFPFRYENTTSPDSALSSASERLQMRGLSSLESSESASSMHDIYNEVMPAVELAYMTGALNRDDGFFNEEEAEYNDMAVCQRSPGLDSMESCDRLAFDHALTSARSDSFNFFDSMEL